MKLNLDAEELDELEGLSDEELAALIRASLAKFRSKRSGAEDNDGPPNNATTTGVTGGPRNGAQVARDSAAHVALKRLIPNIDRLP